VGKGDLKKTITFLSAKWKEFEDYRPFEYFFLDDELKTLYSDERNLGFLSLIFTILILFIASLGLFGLASYLAEKKIKEISIRKVLGASLADIFFLLSKEFVRLIIISMIIAWPLSYYLIDEFFLDQFIIQPGYNLWIPIVAGLLALFLALLITMYRAIKASTVNPAKTLKYE
jgi:putative ABC transport system permease protein